MSVGIIIACYRTPNLTIDCLRSLAGQIGDVPGAKVIVCEDGGCGESAARVTEVIQREGWSDWACVETVYPNRGFAGANNAILRDMMQWDRQPQYFMLLNSDTVARPHALPILYDAIEKRPAVGIISPRLEWADGQPQDSCFRFRNPITEMLAAAGTKPLTQLFHNHDGTMPLSSEPAEADWVSFACALIRREVFQQVGLLDDRYYLYFDDVDYCRRAKQKGWRIMYWPEARVVHLRGQSNPVKSMTADRERLPNYFYASRSRYYAKFYGRSGLWITNLLWTIGRVISFGRELVGNKCPHVCQKQWRDIWTNAWNPLKPPVQPRESGS